LTAVVAADVADALPPALVACTVTRSLLATSPLVGTYVFAVAPEIAVQVEMLFVVQRNH
jgi:hypothetical protein